MSALVKFLYEEMSGAPASVANTAGNLCSVLDAALVNGFNSHNTSGGISVSGTTATVTDTAHGFKDQQVVTIGGASVAACNGDFRITVINANSFSYQVPNGTASPTGTITAKTTPLGWSIAFTATNQRVYRAPSGNRFYLNIDDSAASVNTAVVWGYETCSGINTGTNQIPPTANLSGDNIHRWMRPQYVANGTTQVGWAVIGDDKRFWFGIPGYPASTSRFWCFFGDFTSYLNADAYNTLLAGDCSHGNGASYYFYNNFPFLIYNPTRSGSGSYFTNELCVQRAYDQSTVGVNLGLWSAFAYSSNNCIAASGRGAYDQASTANTPNPITSGFDLTPVDMIEKDTSSGFYWRRGRLPGILHPLGQPTWGYAADKTISTGVGTYGSVIQFSGGNQTAANTGLVFVLGISWDSM